MLKIIKNPDEEFYNKITQAVKNNLNYCPCMLQKTDDTRCMCRAFREQETEGFCRCQRYMKIEVSDNE